MKRLFLCLALFLFCIGISVFNMYFTNYSAEMVNENLDKIQIEVDNGNYEKALNLSVQNNKEYNEKVQSVLSCFYFHKDLDKITQNLAVINVTLKNKDQNSFEKYKELTKKQLQSLKDQELFTIQNIL